MHPAVSNGSYDVARLRQDFPALGMQVYGKPLVYLDNAASAQKPKAVLERMHKAYTEQYANVHRGLHYLANEATEAYEGARETVQRFLNAERKEEIIFTRNATEAINLVAYSWGLANLGPGDVVLVTELEHHANFVPWQYIAGKTGAEFRMLPVDPDGTLHLEQLDELAGEGTVKIVATGYVSNVLGGTNDIPRIAGWAHERGAIHVCDAAQAAPHKRVDVQALGTDFVAVSGHKMCGPSGIGFLWGRSDLLREMDPFLTGGHMIRRVRENESTWGELPHKFEAGTAPMAEAVGLGAAIDYLDEVGLDAIEQHEHELVSYALDLLAEIPGVTSWGPPPERRAGIVSFDVEGVHPHDVAQILDLDAVAIRAGHHCCQPLMRKLGVPATNRASFYLYTVEDEIDRLSAGIRTAQALFA